ncbi:hypothetical protein R3P38DRAFT_3317680 [Favolaschia claudopus]|uniref:Uncharacterized protein n=1 Tax=Favolaschia claudopus TaxID=2862362 RepID=A0AAW0B923_9AGAR
MHLKLKGYGLTADVDAFQFRTTRSGCSFSEWEHITAEGFDMEEALTYSIQLNAGQEEDLAELDTGPPVLAFQSLGLEPPEEPSGAGTVAPPCTRKERDKARSKARRTATRVANREKVDVLLDGRPKHPRHLARNVKPIKTSFRLTDTSIASTGWIGLRDNGVCAAEADSDRIEAGPSPTHELHDFLGRNKVFTGFGYVKFKDPSTRPVVDKTDKVVAVVAGMPDDPNFKRDVHDRAVEAMEAARKKASVSEERQSHRRGEFIQLTTGDSMGGGQQEPGALVNGAINAAILASLVSSEPFVRLAGFATGVFANWAPNLFDFYVSYMGRFYAKYAHLSRPFLNGIFSACTFNLGPQTCALGHRDFNNLAYGWCAITAFGDYDYRKGGHLVLWDCKLIIEFPPGCTILIPSAAMYHSNIPIAEGERRYSFTQYTAGGLFRWVEHGFMTEEAYMKRLTRQGRREEKALGLERAEIGAGLFSTLSDLLAGK